MIVISVAFAAFMSVLDSNIVNISLPTMAQYFNVSMSQIIWVTMAYFLVLTSTLLLFGKLGDRYGNRNLFMLGYLGFVVGSFLCGISPTLLFLIFSRVIQGLGAAILYTTVFSLIPKFISPNRRGWAFGLIATAAALGVTVGAPIGGIITGLFSWHWIFLINVPVGIFAIVFAALVLPQEKVAKKKGSFDFLGAILSFTSCFCLILALNLGYNAGWLTPLILGLFIAAAIFFALLIVWETKANDPLLDLSLFKDRNFLFANISSFMVFAFVSGNAFILPFYLQYERGLKVEYSGLIILTYSLIYMFVGPYGGNLSDRVPPRRLCSLATFSAALAVFVFSFTLALPGLIPTLVFLVWLALSNSFFVSPNNSEVMGLAPINKQGTASGVFKTITNLGMVLGIALFEVVFSSSIPSSITHETYQPGMFVPGFHNVYVFGALIMVVAFYFSFMVKGKKVSPKARTELLGEA